MRGIGEHFRRYAHALRFLIGPHGAKKFHPIVKYKHYQISSGARACLHITEHGVFKLIEGINTRKSSGPDGIPDKLLQSLAKELPQYYVLYLNNHYELMLHRFQKRQQPTSGKLPTRIFNLYYMQTF